MKSFRRLRPNGPALGLIGGYGGSLALVAAAGAVLLLPVFGEDGDSSGGRSGAEAAGTAAVSPGATVPAQRAPGGGTATGTGERQGRGSTPQSQGRGIGPQLPGQGDGTLTWCPDGTAFYRDAGTGLEVTINVSASGLARAEVALRGRSAVSQQDTVRRPGRHTFRFGGVRTPMVERVKVTTVSVGVAVQTCYARAGA